MHRTLALFPGPASVFITGRGPGDELITSVYLQHVDTVVLQHWLQECELSKLISEQNSIG